MLCARGLFTLVFYAEINNEECKVPDDIIGALIEWHGRLGEPKCYVEVKEHKGGSEVEGDSKSDDKSTGLARV